MITASFVYHNTKSNSELEGKIQKKLNKIAAKYDFVVQAHVFISTENDQTNKNGKVCKVQLSVPGPLLFAVEKANRFDVAVQEVFADLNRQLSKKKEKMKAH